MESSGWEVYADESEMWWLSAIDGADGGAWVPGISRVCCKQSALRD